jgi:hypothetical protein
VPVTLSSSPLSCDGTANVSIYFLGTDDFAAWSRYVSVTITHGGLVAREREVP